MIVAYYISENQSDRRGIKHVWYAIEDGGNLSYTRGTRVGFRAPADPVHVLPAVIFGLLGKRELDREERASCGMSVLQTKFFADILSQLTDRVRRALVASGRALEPSIRRQDPLSLFKL
jgi:hypothetical protein